MLTVKNTEMYLIREPKSILFRYGNTVPSFYNYKNTKKGGTLMDYKIISTSKNGNDLLIRCNVCGFEKHVNKYNYKKACLNHNGINCGKMYYDSFVGKRNNDYVITEYLGNYKYKAVCSICGTSEIVSIHSIQTANLSHMTRCIKNIEDSKYKKAICSRYANMKQRCQNKNNTNYSHYGDRGISIDYKCAIDFYLDFIEEFIKFSDIHGINNSTFDRIDVNKGYTKDNIRLATQNIQSTNTVRKKMFVIKKGEDIVVSDSFMEVGRFYNINGRAIGNMVRGKSKQSDGWVLVKILKDGENVNNVIVEEGVTTNLIIT